MPSSARESAPAISCRSGLLFEERELVNVCLVPNLVVAAPYRSLSAFVTWPHLFSSVPLLLTLHLFPPLTVCPLPMSTPEPPH